MFNDKYGLTQAVLEGRKTQTRRTFLKPGEDPLLHGITPEYLISVRSRYSLGETIAIAQKYEDLRKDDEFYRLCGKNGMPLECIKYEKGCHNKMFVRADLMPHHIRITNIRVERLQDISEEDCMAEGIRRFGKEYVRFKKRVLLYLSKLRCDRLLFFLDSTRSLRCPNRQNQRQGYMGEQPLGFRLRF